MRLRLYRIVFDGLSPRVRGNLRDTADDPQDNAPGVYPRVYGGTGRVAGMPLVKAHDGSIPACTGEPQLFPTVFKLRATACTGEPVCQRWPMPGQQGLSPRVRGNPVLDRCPVTYRLQVYPRVYGGTQVNRYVLADLERGSIPACTGEPLHSTLNRYVVPSRSIPACTGEPGYCQKIKQPVPKQVYPRVYGGTCSRCGASKARMPGSIPACTGEPTGHRKNLRPERRSGLSPRVRGNRQGPHFKEPSRPPKGLSPRVRGNPFSAVTVSSGQQQRVYPRVYGGTICRSGPLSAPNRRSIPACTGEPRG